MSRQRLTYLFTLYLQHGCTLAERRELSELLLAAENEAFVRELLGDYWSEVPAELQLDPQRSEAILASILEAVAPKPAQVVRWKRWAVAASVVVLLGVGCWVLGLYLISGKTTDDGPQSTVTAKDIQAPEGNRAVIQLADGRLIYLDSAGNGSLATQSNVVVRKLADGKIVYETTDHPSAGSGQAPIAFNTITNPRGSNVIDMTLSDGSHVWLNAGSSLTYPVVFTGNERKVEITGEAYFEVAHNSAMPFYVSKGNMEVRVLGTHFNVNAYEDEGEVKVTLLEGSVEVKSKNSKLKINPGEQAVINADNGQLTTDNRIDLRQVMAWKEGWFEFDNTKIAMVLRQVARWYDLQVVYRGKVPDEEVGGRISRDLPLSALLKMLQSNGVSLELQGHTLYVK